MIRRFCDHCDKELPWDGRPVVEIRWGLKSLHFCSLAHANYWADQIDGPSKDLFLKTVRELVG